MEIIIPEGKTPLFCRYQGQQQEQPAYIVLKPEDKILTADYSGEIGNAVPCMVYHNRILWWGIPSSIYREALETLLEKVRPYAERIIEGYYTEFDGSNLVGRLTDDAKEAGNKIEEICEEIAYDPNMRMEVYSCEDYIYYDDLNSLWPDGKKIDEAATEIIENALSEYVILYGDMEDALLEKLIITLQNDKIKVQVTEEQALAIKSLRPEYEYLIENA